MRELGVELDAVRDVFTRPSKARTADRCSQVGQENTTANAHPAWLGAEFASPSAAVICRRSGHDRLKADFFPLRCLGHESCWPRAMDFVEQLAESPLQRNFAAEERIIPVGDTFMRATLNLTRAARGIIALLHASSANRFGVPSRFASEVFGQAGFATLQVDLLTPAEEALTSLSQRPEQHVPLLFSRTLAVVDWLSNQRETVDLTIGLFASRQETIPALMAAERNRRIVAVASQGGYPDFAPDAVRELRAPTLLIVGRDEQARAAELASEFFARQLAIRTA